jgi:hypothetical protein
VATYALPVGCPPYVGATAADAAARDLRGRIVNFRVKRDALERCLRVLRAAETRRGEAEVEVEAGDDDFL